MICFYVWNATLGCKGLKFESNTETILNPLISGRNMRNQLVRNVFCTTLINSKKVLEISSRPVSLETQNRHFCFQILLSSHGQVYQWYAHHHALCFLKKIPLTNFQWMPATFLKKFFLKNWRCFQVSFPKFFMAVYFQETTERLLLNMSRILHFY